PAAYRPKEYLVEGKSRDPIDKARAKLLGLGVAEADLDAIDRAMAAEIEEAYQFAKNSPDPDPAEVTRYMYTSDNERCVVR
ncbi:MAG: thiamine pyrophosphate-dependent enzyme, partial [Oscillibacter sp.]